MAQAAFWVRERWFEWGLRFFAVGALAAILVIALVALPQMRVLGVIALAQALAGMAVCAVGLRHARPARWNTLRMRVRAAVHRLRQRLRPALSLSESAQVA
jgi:hypothetical protein